MLKMKTFKREEKNSILSEKQEKKIEPYNKGAILKKKKGNN